LIPIFVALLSTLTLLPTAPPKQTRVEISKVWVALSAHGHAATNQEVRVRKDTPITAWLVVEARVSGRRRIFSNAPELKKGKKTLSRVERWPADLESPNIKFLRLEADPKGGIYDNTGKLEAWWHPERNDTHPESWHWCPIDYAESDSGWGSVWSHQVNARPTKTPDKYDGLGTMRFVAKVTFRGKEYRSIGQEHRDKAGLKPGIATIRVRMNDSPVGFMTELINVPYVYGSHTPTGRINDHQSERGVGADCADLMVYGWRRSGRRLTYTWTQGLKKLTRLQVRASTVKDGVYQDKKGQPIRFGEQVRPNDILLWGRHVAAVVSTDKSGFLTPKTIILHTLTGSPMMGPLKDIGFGFDTMEFEVRRPNWLRWKKY